MTERARFLGSRRSRNRTTAAGKTNKPIDSFETELVRRRKLPKKTMNRPATKPPSRRPVAFTPNRYAGTTESDASSGMTNWTWAGGERPPTEMTAHQRTGDPGSFGLKL